MTAALAAGGASLGRTGVFVGGGIGDALFHVGHFIGIAAHAEGGKITLLCKKGIELGDLLGGSDFVGAVIGMADDQAHSGYVGLFRAASIFRGRFDTVFFFHRSTTITYAARLAGVPNRFGFVTSRGALLSPFSKSIVVPASTGYPELQSKANLLLAGLGIGFSIETARLAPSAAALKAADALLGATPAVAIGLNASAPGKQWGGERFGALIAALARDGDFRFLLYGGPDVAAVATTAIKTAGLPAERFVDICTKPRPLSVSHALLSRCRFYVGNDSHGLNLAVHSGIPAIGLFGTTSPLTYSPLLVPLTVPPERLAEGIAGISVERVLQACREMLWAAAPDCGGAMLANRSGRL